MQHTLTDQDKSDVAMFRRVDSLISYYTSYNPHELTDEQWGIAFNDLLWIRKKEAEKNK